MAEKPTPVYDESKIKTLSSLEYLRLRTGHMVAARAERVGRTAAARGDAAAAAGTG